jgi:hypothetical protein
VWSVAAMNRTRADIKKWKSRIDCRHESSGATSLAIYSSAVRPNFLIEGGASTQAAEQIAFGLLHGHGCIGVRLSRGLKLKHLDVDLGA